MSNETIIVSDEAKRLQLFMDREDLSQKELGRIIGKPASTVNKYLKGKLIIPFQVVKTLHFKFRINFNWFYVGVGHMKLTEKDKDANKKSLITDVSDIKVDQAQILARMESMEVKFNKLVRDFYAAQQN